MSRFMRATKLSAAIFALMALLPSESSGADSCLTCGKRMFGYHTDWSAPAISPSSTKCNHFGCSSSTCKAACDTQTPTCCLTTPAGGLASICDSKSGQPMTAVASSASSPLLPASVCATANKHTFRLCVICPDNVEVIIDGRRTTSSGKVREFCLNLSEVAARNVDLTVIKPGTRPLFNEAIHVARGKSQTLVVYAKPAEAKTKEQVAVEKQLDAVLKQLQAIDSRLGELSSTVEGLSADARADMARREKELKAKARALAKQQRERDAMQVSREGLQTERDELQQRRDKLQIERDQEQVAREKSHTNTRAALAQQQKELNQMQDAREKLQTERDELQQRRDKLQTERDKLQQERDKLQQERDMQ